MDFEYGLDDDTGRLLSYANLDVYEFKNGSWVLFDGVFGSWLDSKPVTESEAMRITSGAKPA